MPHEQPHHLDETVWMVKGPVRIRKTEVEGKSVWVAEDAEGVAAMAPSRESLLEVLHDEHPK